jgi:hypothetical protein
MRNATPAARIVVVLGACTACSMAAGLDDLQFDAETALPDAQSARCARPRT